MSRLREPLSLAPLLLVLALAAAQCGIPSDAAGRPVSVSGLARLSERPDGSTNNLDRSEALGLTTQALTLTLSSEADASGPPSAAAPESVDIAGDADTASSEQPAAPSDDQASEAPPSAAPVNQQGCGDNTQAQLEATAWDPCSPSAETAELNRIVQPDTPECASHCAALGGTPETCSASLCAPGEFPFMPLSALAPQPASPGDTVQLSGAFGPQRGNLSVALAQERDGRLLYRYRLAVSSWDDDTVVATVHEGVQAGLYRILLVYHGNVGPAGRLLFVQGSESLAIRVESP